MASGIDSDIAVIGMACRFPGDADCPEKLWQLLEAGNSAFKHFPSDRLNIDGFYHPSPERADSFNFRGAHLIDGDITAFDREFFGLSTDESKAIDPQQRLLLEVAYEALENAGQKLDKIKGSETSVWIGSFVKDYEQVSMTDSQAMLPDCATGNGCAILSNRISFAFDLRGTSQTIDTGCSGSLVAIHQAAHDLMAGNSDMAIAGGVGLIMTPGTIMPMNSLGFLSKDGKCFTFDSRANGYGRGEGAGIVVLKTLKRALEDNDTIRGVIRGTASNQDGRTPGITVPNSAAQVACIKKAYSKAGVPYEHTQYVECHGTGTLAGDPRELSAISQVLCQDRRQPLVVGSIKPNIGHLEGAAGIAGFIKAVLVLEKGLIPKHINFERWNPAIKHEEWKVDVAHSTIALPIPKSEIRRVSVNCFGFGGTNAHAVVDDGGGYLDRRNMIGHHNTDQTLNFLDFLRSQTMISPRNYVFVFSAQQKGQLSRMVKAHIPFIMANRFSSSFMRDYQYTLYSRRNQLKWVYSFVAPSPAHLLSKMSLELDESRMVRTSSGKPYEIAYIFCGQGAQWSGMAHMFMGFPAFRASIESAAAFIKPKFLSPTTRFDLLRVLLNPDSDVDINLPIASQIATTALQVAFVELTRSHNIFPAAVVGHSSGEIAAAFCAGYITREDAWSLAFYRGVCAGELSEDARVDGCMLVIGKSRRSAEQIAKATPGTIRVACHNSPSSVTMSGDRADVLNLKGELDRAGFFTKELLGGVAYHSHHMLEVADKYRNLIQGIDAQPSNGRAPTTTMYSSLTGTAVIPQLMTSEYWVENMVCPVEFNKAMVDLMENSMPHLFLEVGPRPVFTRAITEIAAAVYPGSQAPAAAFMQTGTHEGLSGLLAQLWIRGHKADVEPSSGNMPKCLADLPPYPWDHSKSYIYETHHSKQLRFRQFGRLDYLGALTTDSIMPQSPKWRGFFRVSENPWLLDHKIQGEVIYPAAGMVVMAIEAGRQLVHHQTQGNHDIYDFEVSSFDIMAPMVIPTDERGLEHVFTSWGWETTSELEVAAGRCTFTIYSRRNPNLSYQANASGTLTVRFHAKGAAHNGGRLHPDIQGIGWASKADEQQSRSVLEFYEDLNVIGIEYGPQFRGITSIGHARIETGEGENDRRCETIVRVIDTKSKMPLQFEYDHVIHPATLDSIFQTVFTLGDRKMLPVRIHSLRVNGSIERSPGTSFRGMTSAEEMGPDGDVSASIMMVHREHEDEMGDWAVEVKGLLVKSIMEDYDNPRFLTSNRHLCSRVEWEKAPLRPIDVSMRPVDRVILLRGPHEFPIARLFRKLLEAMGVAVFIVRNLDYLPDIGMASCPIVSVLQFVDSAIGYDMDAAQYESLKQIFLNWDQILWVSNGAQMRSSSPKASAIVGWARTMRSEDSAKHIVSFDFDSNTVLNLDAAKSLLTVFLEHFHVHRPAIALDAIETEYAERDYNIYVPRLHPMAELNAVIERNLGSEENLMLDSSASYLLVGGLGGVGLDVAMFLAAHGARHLIFFSRSGLNPKNLPEGNLSPAMKEALTRFEEMGVAIYALEVDICNDASLSAAFSRIRALPRLKGVIQAAGVLRDMTYRNMTHEAWTAAARVKTVGTSNLVKALPKDLDFLLLLSSAAGVIGNRGQANYVAGNAFQDAMARACRSLAPPIHAVSLDLGPIVGAGMVDQDMLHLLRGVGFFGIRKKDFHTVLGKVLADAVGERTMPPQIVMGVGTGGLIRQNKPADPFWSRTALFEVLNRLDTSPEDVEEDGAEGSSRLGLLDLKPMLRAAATVDDAVQIIYGPLVAAMVSIIPNLEASEVEPDMTPNECNSDSMRGVNIDNWLKRTTGVSVGIGLNAMTIRGICEEVISKGCFVAE